MKNTKMRLFQNFSFGTATLNDAVLQGVSLKNCKTCPKTNRVFGQVQLFVVALPALALVVGMALTACGGGGKEYVATDRLNVRSEPDTSADNIVAKLAEGDKVTLLGKGKTDSMDGITAPWFKVKNEDGKIGWVFSGYLTAAAAKGAAKEAEKAEKEAEKAQAAAQKELAAAKKPAVTAPESDFEVKLDKAGTGAVITKYTGPGGNIIIPATIQGMPVTEVYMNPPKRKVGAGEYNTFKPSNIQSIDDVEKIGQTTEITIDANTTLISVVIPEGVKAVGGFRNCIALRSVTLPTSLTTLYFNIYTEGAFTGCTSLVSVTIPGSVTEIDSYAFSGCTSLASVTIQDDVTTIGHGVFQDCTNLASVTIPGSVTEIDSYAFSGCTSLASVTIPDGVTAIRNVAFSSCTSLTSVTIPDSVTIIDIAAFRGCTNLVTVAVSPVKRTLFDGNVFTDCPKLSLASQAAIKAALAAADRTWGDRCRS